MSLGTAKEKVQLPTCFRFQQQGNNGALIAQSVPFSAGVNSFGPAEPSHHWFIKRAVTTDYWEYPCKSQTTGSSESSSMEPRSGKRYQLTHLSLSISSGSFAPAGPLPDTLAMALLMQSVRNWGALL